MFKACAANKGYLFTGAHNLWRIALSCILAFILIITEMIHPGHNPMHYIAALAVVADAGLLWLHTEKSPMPLLFPILEAGLTVVLAFGVSDKGRMTAPVIFMIAGFRLAGELWPLQQDEDAFK